ncbi:amidohydrolase [Acinetobacter sp. ANC 4779]|uniref:amidohydrolase n=1 Tax=Acinetobacter sp. ANC 4779 TaxID=2529848 RepID=UPI001BC88749|nr:amidohydrolase [Acinetobacter sp. ANC 4779]
MKQLSPNAPRRFWMGSAVLSTLALALTACGNDDEKHQQTKQADLIFESAAVYTADAKGTQAQAVAVKDGKIVYVGNDAGLKTWRGEDTRVINLQGKTLLPGFIDTHNHAYLRAESMYWVNLTAPSLEGYKQETQAFLATRPDIKQVRGVGWNLKYILEQAEATGRSPAQLLDDIVGKDIPAVFITHGHHEVWANTRAMQNAGITKDTQNPPGAFIDRDNTGEPTGILREFGAQNLVISVLPQPDFSVQEYKDAILSFQEDLAPQRGVTSVMVPIHYPTDTFLDAMQALDKENKLTVRYDLLQWADENRGTEQIPGFIERRAKYKGKFFKTDSIKIFGTGASSTYGSVVWDQEVLKKTVAELDREKFRVYIHNIGPTRTYNLMLDAFEYALQQNGPRDARHMITHVSDEAIPTIPRFKALNIRADGHPLPKAFFDAGVLVNSSSDYPVREFFPMTRIAGGVKSGVPLNVMLNSHTIQGAEAIFAEKETGSIEVGKAADLVVMDQDLFKLQADKLEDSQVLMTVFHGKVVYDDLKGTAKAKNEIVIEVDDGHKH